MHLTWLSISSVMRDRNWMEIVKLNIQYDEVTWQQYKALLLET